MPRRLISSNVDGDTQFTVNVNLTGNTPEQYAGHRLTIDFKRRDVITDDKGTETAFWEPARISIDLPPSGSTTTELPARGNMSGNVIFSVFAPDGELLQTATYDSGTLGDLVEVHVNAKAYAHVEMNPDPNAHDPSRIRGRIIDSSGRQQALETQVVIWGAQKPDPQDVDFRALLVVQTDGVGYFSGPYPSGSFTAAHASVAIQDRPVEVAIHLDDDGKFPGDLLLVVDFTAVPSSGMGTEGGACDCETAVVPRDPDGADLGRADGTFSNDGRRCVDFTTPNRTLEEFTFSYVVRTTEPVIKGLTLEEPTKIDVTRIAGLLAARFPVKNAPAASRTQQLPFSTRRIDARILQTLTRDPDGFSLTRVATAADLTVHGDILRMIAREVAEKPGRGRMTCETPVDWDDEPTIYQACTIAHGHLLRFKQEWVADGYSMGNLLYSLPLAPGQKKQVAIVDWERRESASRVESLEEREALAASLSRDRDINDIVHATVSESVRGGSSSSAGGIAGGLGIAAIIPPVGGLLGVAGGMSSASSDAWQDSSRSTTANALNQLRDRTVQSSSSVRSQRSSVIQTVREGERVVATTESVANYNHCHAITIQYFEVLRHLLVRQRLADVQECLFVPLLMSRFTSDKALRWRNTLSGVVPDRSLRGGFDALDRIKNNYAGSDFPIGTYADQALENLEGELYLRFQLARPRDKDDDFDAAAWTFLSTLFPFISPSDFYQQYLKGQAQKDQIFQQHLAPKIAERFVQHLQFFAVDGANAKKKLPVDTTLVANYVNDRPLYVSLRLSGPLPTILRRNIVNIEISDLSGILPGPIGLVSLLPAGSKVIVESGSLRYRTKYSSDALFSDARILNDLVGGDVVRIFTPLNRQELRNPREEDKELSRRLLDHLNENLERYHHAIWWRMSPDRRYMLLDGFQAPDSSGRSLASVVENELVGIVGNSLIMPVARGFHLDPTYRQDDVEHPIDLIEHYQPNTPIEPTRIAIPTPGVYAEAVMGACNSCEVKEEQRFWRWEESPIPDSPSAIQPVSTDTRRTEPPDMTAKDFPAPMINLQTAPVAPDPAGLTAALQLLGAQNLFKDITGLEGTQRNAAAALQSAFQAAQFFGGKAADLALQAKMAKDIDKTMRTIQAAKQAGLIDDKQAQELSSSAIRAMIGGGNQSPAKPMTTDEVERLTKTAGANDASVSVTRPGGENVAVNARPQATTASLQEPLQQQCGFFNRTGVLAESDVRDAIVQSAEVERDLWFDATPKALVESDDSQFGHLVRYWLARQSAILPSTLQAAQAKAVDGTVNYGQLLNATISSAVLNAEASRVRTDILASAAVTSAPPNLNALVETAIKKARSSRKNGDAWSAVFIVHCVRNGAITLSLEWDDGAVQQGRDALLEAHEGHRVYVVTAYHRRFGPNRMDGTYHAFRPAERAIQVGDIIIQDRQANAIGDVWSFDNIPALVGGRELHGDLVVDVEADHVVTVGGNLGQSVRRRRYPLDADGTLTVARDQLYTQESDAANLPPIAPPAGAPGLDSLSTGRIFTVLSLVQLCATLPGQKMGDGVLV